VRLTPAGAQALVHLRVAHRELEAALAAAADPGTLALRIGALPVTLVQPLPAALARLRRALPQVQVQLGEDIVPSLWRRLEAGEFDAIVCRLPALSEQPRLPPGVAHRTVGEDSLVMVCGHAHPIAGRRRPPLAALREYAWVLPPEGSYTRLIVDQMFMRAGLAGPHVAIASMSFHTNLRLAADGELLAVAPRSAARAVQKALGLSLFTMDWGREVPSITLAWREANLVNPALVGFLACF
jgi:DNA-binding transcriptional LysR family regulator